MMNDDDDDEKKELLLLQPARAFATDHNKTRLAGNWVGEGHVSLLLAERDERRAEQPEVQDCRSLPPLCTDATALYGSDFLV